MSEKFSFIFPYEHGNPNFYRVIGSITGAVLFGVNYEDDGKYSSKINAFKVNNASIGDMYILCTGSFDHKYYVLLDRIGTVSDPMDQEEIMEHFKFVRAST